MPTLHDVAEHHLDLICDAYHAMVEAFNEAEADAECMAEGLSMLSHAVSSANYGLIELLSDARKGDS